MKTRTITHSTGRVHGSFITLLIFMTSLAFTARPAASGEFDGNAAAWQIFAGTVGGFLGAQVGGVTGMALDREEWDRPGSGPPYNVVLGSIIGQSLATTAAVNWMGKRRGYDAPFSVGLGGALMGACAGTALATGTRHPLATIPVLLLAPLGAVAEYWFSEALDGPDVSVYTRNGRSATAGIGLSVRF